MPKGLTMTDKLHRDNQELVIFLDIDGVLAHSKSIPNGRKVDGKYSFKWAAQIDPECAKRVVRIVRATGAQIVISSTWRRDHTQVTGIKRALVAAGMVRNEMLGVWEKTPWMPSSKEPRATEILSWLAEHPEVERHVVLDDGWTPGCSTLSSPLPNHFSDGLQDSHADEAIAILLREPMEIQYVIGDATRPKGDSNKVIVHICNDVGAWGRGFVMALSNRWPEPEKKYRHWHSNPKKASISFSLGNIQVVSVSETLSVCNLIGQRDIRGRGRKTPIRYKAVCRGLEKLALWAKENDASVHMPRIGCGLAGGDWETMGPIVQEALCDKYISVTVYDLKQQL